MRKTKIICTIGPASESEEILTQLCQEGMNVARLNFSHGSHEEQLVRIQRIRKVREKLGLPVAIMLDTKGPEYRIRTFKNGKVQLVPGDTFTFTSRDIVGDEHEVAVNFKGLPESMEPGDTILLSNGLLSFEVQHVTETDVVCTVVNGGVLSDRKSMNFPGKVIEQPYLSEQDRSDILFGVRNGVDFIACSFVSRKQDLLDIRNMLAEEGEGDRPVELIAKIENSTGIENIEQILEECSGIMIGRGDMGVEIPFEKLPALQKMLISKCLRLGKRVITATEMLESMIHNPRPTRAETSDVANAIYDGSSAIMLSGETAAGEYPVLTLQTMSRIAEETEKGIEYDRRFHDYEDFRIRNTVDAISHSVCGMAIDLNAKAIVVCSLSGMTVRMVSRFRSPAPIIGLTTDESAWRRLAMNWGVMPVMCDTFDSTDVLFYVAKQNAKERLQLEEGDTIVITGGLITGNSGNTNLIKIDKI
ncbi:MAG: pyruvate kinase [Eubacteriales bacterium]|nr:pyruvate kinase [Eubacteriales bacterium]